MTSTGNSVGMSEANAPMNTPLEALERLKELAGWLEPVGPDAEGSFTLAASVAQEHSADLRSLLTSYEAQGERLREVEGALAPFALNLSPNIYGDADDVGVAKLRAAVERRLADSESIPAAERVMAALPQLASFGDYGGSEGANSSEVANCRQPSFTENVEALMGTINDVLTEATVDYPAGRDAGHRIDYDDDAIRLGDA